MHASTATTRGFFYLGGAGGGGGVRKSIGLHGCFFKRFKFVRCDLGSNLEKDLNQWVVGLIYMSASHLVLIFFFKITLFLKFRDDNSIEFGQFNRVIG
jgi:hypothetical protein